MKTSPSARSDGERVARAREVGRQQAMGSSAVVAARYDTLRHGIELEFRSGATMAIPRQLIAALDGAPLRELVSVTVSPAGDAISWRALDVDLYVPGLVERAFGRGLFEAIIEPVPAPPPPVPVVDEARPMTGGMMCEAEAAQYIGMSAGWLKKSRTARFKGLVDAPSFIRAGAKRIVYRRTDLDTWVARHIERVGPKRS